MILISILKIYLINATIHPQISPKSFFTLELFTLVWGHLMPNVSYVIYVYPQDLWLSLSFKHVFFSFDLPK